MSWGTVSGTAGNGCFEQKDGQKSDQEPPPEILALFGVGGGETLVGGFAGGGGVRGAGEFDAVFGEFCRLQRQDAAFIRRKVHGEGLGARGALDLVETDLAGGEGFAEFEAARLVFGIGDGVGL